MILEKQWKLDRTLDLMYYCTVLLEPNPKRSSEKTKPSKVTNFMAQFYFLTEVHETEVSGTLVTDLWLTVDSPQENNKQRGDEFSQNHRSIALERRNLKN